MVSSKLSFPVITVCPTKLVMLYFLPVKLVLLVIVMLALVGFGYTFSSYENLIIKFLSESYLTIHLY
jgi:hypothetical protein